MYKNILLIYFLCAMMPIFGAQQTVNPEKFGAYPDKSLRFPKTIDDRLATDGMLIFLDDFENQLGPVSKKFLFALSQKAGPILASSSLLKAIESTPDIIQLTQTMSNPPSDKIRKYFDALKKAENLLKENPEELSAKKLLIKINTFLQEQANILDSIDQPENKTEMSIKNLQQTVQNNLIKEFTHWNQDEWIIKAIDTEHQLLLLIPKDYMFKRQSIKIPSERDTLQRSDPLTELEYNIGIKINHMKTVTDYRTILNKPATSPDTYFMQALSNSDIFVSRAEYFAASQQIHEQPQWAFYMCGHAELGKYICGLSIQAFSRFLDFLDTKINTGLLIYVSCYTIGTNQKLIYKDLDMPLKLSFPIVTSGFFDALANHCDFFNWSAIDFNFVDWKSNKFTYFSHDNFKYFFIDATSKNPHFDSIISAVLKCETIHQVPIQIRVGNSDFFNIKANLNPIVTIGTPFAQTCAKIDLNKKFAQKSGFVMEPHYFLYTPIIPCELIISSPKYEPVFFPMASLKSSNQSAFMYYIKKLTAPHHSLKNIYDMFTKWIPQKYSLYVFIDEIELKKIDDRTSYDKPQTIRDAILINDIHRKPYKNYILFTFTEQEQPQQIDVSAEKFYKINFDSPLLEKEKTAHGDYRDFRNISGLTDALAQFEKEKRKPTQEIEKTLQEKIKRGDRYNYSESISNPVK